jgi:V/A-type H+-transporting ATPase subunit A
MRTETAKARVTAVEDALVRFEVLPDAAGQHPPITKNEVVTIASGRMTARGEPERLRGEVLRVRGTSADAQVFESTEGVGIGDTVEQTGELLSVELGPGLLGQVFDGLQMPLPRVAADYGIFLPRGATADALPLDRKWSFTAAVQAGATVEAGDVVGTVQEGRFAHRIMVPFGWPGRYSVAWIQEGAFTVREPVARLSDGGGQSRTITLSQRWPVRVPLAGKLLRRGRARRIYPSEPLVTTQRLIDSFFPIARGGTACIPGPFGAGKTVLQNLIARHASVDVVVVVACGERAGEVVETITEFPELTYPRTGGTLMDRTVIVCNTSSMPVAAREASIFTGITIGEYYRQMGYDVLLIADSTSRWAQAMRETSGRLEEIPGDEGFPAYLESAIKGVYERAGIVETADGHAGSLTIIGTVSPAGGNFDEPVTQATLGTVKCFLGLSAERAYKRFYPAVDPLLSWSRYGEQLSGWFDAHVEPGWSARIAELQRLLADGQAVEEMMQVTGEEGITLADFVTHQKATVLDMAYLQQDAFDAVDASVSLDRQKDSLARVHALLARPYDFAGKDAARDYFTRLTGLLKNLNYADARSPEHAALKGRIEALAAAQP